MRMTFKITDLASERFGRGTGPVFIDYINCTGSEGSLWRGCLHFNHYSGCSHDLNVGVQCKPGEYFYQYAIGNPTESTLAAYDHKFVHVLCVCCCPRVSSCLHTL